MYDSQLLWHLYKFEQMFEQKSEQKFISEEEQKLEKLIEQEIKHLKCEGNNHQSSTEEDQSECEIPQNVYFDKQLTHLVLSEEFDFKEISNILATVFRFQQIDTSENACRLRWAQLHKSRNNQSEIRERIKEEKRIRSVAAFANPYSLYSVDELIDNLEMGQKERENKINQISIPEPQYDGYNIFRDNFRKIKDFQQYNKMEKQMKEALKLAQMDIYEQKPLFFSPQYQKSSEFKVKEEEMTAQKMRKLMAFQIQIQKVSRQMNRTDPTQHEKYESVIKRKVERESRRENDDADFDENWDDYQSD